MDPKMPVSSSQDLFTDNHPINNISSRTLQASEEKESIYEILERMENLKDKEKQKHFFQNHIQSMGLNEITDLCLYMKNIQENLIDDNYFKTIRTERNSFFHSGETRTWQTLFTMAKFILLTQLRKEFNPWENAISLNQFIFYAGIFGTHSGRYYRCGNTTTLTLFTAMFIVAKEEKPSAGCARPSLL